MLLIIDGMKAETWMTVNTRKKTPAAAGKKMTRWGVGLRVAVIALFTALAAMALSFLFPGLSAYPLISHPVRLVIGLALLAPGLALWITSVITVMRAYSSRRLCTSGPFALCRHPVYASWVVFILPALSLLLNSWFILVSPLALWIAIVKSAPEEEEYLEALFGDSYRAYRDRVPMVLPLGRMAGVLRKKASTGE